MMNDAENQNQESKEPLGSSLDASRNNTQKDNEKEVVALRPIWKAIISLLIGAICLAAVYNLFHTYCQLKHPRVGEKKPLLTFATELDTRWLEDSMKQVAQTKPTHPNSGKEPVKAALMQNSNPPLSQGVSDTIEEERKAMGASISSNQITVELIDNKLASDKSEQLDHQNHLLAQSENPKEDKANTETSAQFEKKLSPYTLQAGTIIPGVLITGINSSLPGQVTAQVRNSVYDSIEGKYRLIPQGSKLVGNYESKICFGQKRLFLIWQRIILPNGDSIHLGGMPGSSLEGYSGFQDQVDNHTGLLFKSALLMSILSTGAQAASSSKESTHLGPEILAQSAGLQFAETGSQLISKSMEVEPTLTIRPGYLFNITVTKDIVFEHPYSQ